MNCLRTQLNKALYFFTAIALIALVLIVLLGILTNTFKLQITWTEECAKFLLGWVVMLGAVIAYIENAHLGVDILVTRFSPPAQRVSKLFTTIVVAVFSTWVMVYGGGQLFLSGLESGQLISALGIRKAWFYLSLPVSGTLITIFAIDNFLHLLRDKTFEESTTGEATK